MRIRICNITFYSHPVIHLNKQIVEFVNFNIRNYSADYLIFILILVVPLIIILGVSLIPGIVINSRYYYVIIQNDLFRRKRK